MISEINSGVGRVDPIIQVDRWVGRESIRRESPTPFEVRNVYEGVALIERTVELQVPRKRLGDIESPAACGIIASCAGKAFDLKGCP